MSISADNGVPPAGNGIPSVELLEKVHRFPGPYMIKAIGKAEDDFVARVLREVRLALSAEADPPHTLRHTAGGKHVAITLQLQVDSAHQVRAIYGRVMGTVGLVLLM
jgi:putative lipoic acid-binding regulatory protein